MYVYDLKISARGTPSATYVGLTVEQLRDLLARRPRGAEYVLRPREAAHPARRDGGRWL